MTTSILSIHNPTDFFNFPSDTTKEKRTHSRFQIPTYSNGEYIWSYLGKINAIARNLLNASARIHPLLKITGKNYVGVVRNLTTHMKLFSLFTVIFSWNGINSVSKKIFNGLSHRDKEAVLLGTLSFTIITVEIVDSLTTFINNGLTVISANSIAAFSTLGLPIAYLMSGLGIISRTIQIAKTSNLYRHINKEILSNENVNQDLIKKFLEKKLGINEELKFLLSLPVDQLSNTQLKKIEVLKEKNQAAILRSAPKAAVEDLEKLLALIEKNPLEETLSKAQLNLIFKTLENVQLELKKKVKNDVLGLVASLISLAATILLTIGSISFWPFLLLALAVSIRLSSVIYQNKKINKHNLEMI